MEDLGLIKVCGDPHCEAIWHNIPKNITRCNDCGGRVMIINQDTFMKKYANNFFQYDFNTGEYYRPAIDKQLCLEFEKLTAVMPKENGNVKTNQVAQTRND